MKALSLLFLKLGIVAFGGPAAHTALLETEVVSKRKWMRPETFLELMSITNLIPGPNSSELVMAIGYQRHGIKGLLVAGISFLVPAMVMVIALTLSLQWIDVKTLSLVSLALTPVIAVIILKALVNLLKKQKLEIRGISILVGSLVLKIFSVDEFIIVAMGALLYTVWDKIAHKFFSVEPFSFILLTMAFVKIGATLYGSGYVLLSYLETTFVNQLGWLTYPQIVQAFTIGELTPGPVFTTATSVGTLLAGVPGGILATVGIFAPSFVLMLLVMPISSKLLANGWVKIALKGIAFSSLGMMFYVASSLTYQSLQSIPLALLLLMSIIAIFKYKVNPVYLIAFMPVMYVIIIQIF